MTFEETIGNTITNVYQILNFENGGFDKGECFVELDNQIIIDIPYNSSDEIYIKELSENAESIFKDLSDYPVYLVNKEGKSIKEIVEKYSTKQQTFWDKVKGFINGGKTTKPETTISEYQPYAIEYKENKLKYLKNAVTKTILFFEDSDEKVFY